jgi:hypothetical protein
MRKFGMVMTEFRNQFSIISRLTMLIARKTQQSVISTTLRQKRGRSSSSALTLPEDDMWSIDSESFSSSGHQRRSRSRSSRISQQASQKSRSVQQQSLQNSQELQNQLLQAQIETQLVTAAEARARTKKMELETLLLERNLRQAE